MDALPLKEFRRLDLNSEELGVPLATLMANAGKALADAANGMRGSGPVVFVCGKGNNAGDGYAAAAALVAEDVPVKVVWLEDPTHDAVQAFHALPAKIMVPWGEHAGLGPGVIVDCLLGSGIRGTPRPPYDDAIAWINDQSVPVLSCDIPSGFGTSIVVRPTRTLTFHAAKEGLTGAFEVVDIGIPADAKRIGFGDLDAGYVRPGGAHKGEHGRLLVVGGGPFTGAPHYAGMAALRTGCDLVHVAAPAPAAATIATWGPELMVHALPGDILTLDAVHALKEILQRVDAVVVGPGLGKDAATQRATAAFLDAVADADVPCVVDADGLDAVTDVWVRRHGHRTVLTPHAQEFRDLAHAEPDDGSVVGYARLGVTVLRKGATDFVTDGTQHRSCVRGHVTMTVGGTGDVLAGIVGALLSKGAAPFDAACAAAYLSGVSGEVAASFRGWGATATDVLEAIPHTLLRLEQA